MTAARNLRQEAKRLPAEAGVYRFLAADGSVLYVGKAANLAKRVSSYFAREHADPRIAAMVAQADAMEVSVTRTEGEALLLENQLIKSLKPRYNVLLRDDKSYPYIYLSGDHAYPRLGFHRGPRKKKGRFFGPYPSAGAVRATLNQLQKLFLVRQCEDTFFQNRSRPCLQYQIERCTAPCVGLVDEAQYADQIRHVTMFLEGRSSALVRELVRQMEAASAALDFERAARIRDQIGRIKRVQAQHFVTGKASDVDVISAVQDAGVTCVRVYFFRGGTALGDRTYFPSYEGEVPIDEVLRAFLVQLYLHRKPPKDIICHPPPADRPLIEDALAAQSARRVSIVSKPRGDRANWLKMARQNAQTALDLHLSSRARVQDQLHDLRELLNMDALPERVECFDISHTMGEAMTAACVVFDDQGPVKSAYRRFHIRKARPGDDYGALREALERRYRRLKEGEAPLPDLLLIDGGKGQVRQAVEVLEELQVVGVQVVGVAKGPGRRPGDEQLIIAAGNRSLRPGRASLAGHFVQQIRDEAHRFALAGHRAMRARTRHGSILDDIPGVGPKRRRTLLTHFGGIRGLSAAGIEEIAALDGISHELAERIHGWLREDSR